MMPIYAIQNIETGKCYLGSTKNSRREARWNQHLRHLREGRHHSTYLQRAWNKYGENAFYYYIVQDCKDSERIEIEQIYLDAYWDNLYNCAQYAAGGGTRSGQKNSPEHNAKISTALKRNKNRVFFLQGRKRPEHWDSVWVNRIENRKFDVVVTKDCGESRRFATTEEASKWVGCGRTTIKNILNGYTKSNYSRKYKITITKQEV